MKTKMILTLVVGALLVLGLYGPAIAGGGGPEDPGGCTGTPPTPNTPVFVKGEFTAAPYDDFNFGKFFVVAISLKHGVKKDATRRLFSFVASEENICDVTKVTPEYLKDKFKWVPCRLGVAGAFNIVGVPVITDLEITKVDQCNTEGAMLLGEVVIGFYVTP
jgi:hypothetical protein